MNNYIYTLKMFFPPINTFFENVFCYDWYYLVTKRYFIQRLFSYNYFNYYILMQKTS